MGRQETAARAAARLSVLMLALVAGCTMLASSPLKRVPSQRDAGVTDVAVIYAEPWDVVAQTLTPTFDISAESALRQVIPSTSNELNRFLDAIDFRFGLGLRRSTTTSERTQSEATGQQPTTQSTTTRRVEPGTAPEPAAGSPAGERTAASLPGAEVLAREIAQEPLLRYKAAVALYQEVRMLNRYVQGAARGSDYVPYLVRLQITLMPYARNLPYDVYSNVSFFLASGKANEHPDANLPFVVPLVVTDALEGGSTSTSAETVRQLAFALGGTLSNAALTAQGGSLQDALRSISGVTLNSLQTISRLGDNGVRVRLGAVKSPIASDAFVMVPRTHNATLLLLVPKEWIKSEEKAARAPKIEMAARSHFYDTILGTRLRTFDEKNSHVGELEGIGKLYLTGDMQKKEFEIPENCPGSEYHGGGAGSTAETRKQQLLLYLVEQVQGGNLGCFSKALKANYAAPIQPHYLWNDMSMLANSYGFSGTSFQLPRSPAAEPPPRQTVLLMDDGKATTTALLRNGVGLVPERIVASLVVGKKDSKPEFEMPALAAAASGPALQLTFPSLAKVGVTKEGKLQEGRVAELRLWQRTDAWNRSSSAGYEFQPCAGGESGSPCGTYSVVLQGAPPEPAAGLKFETAVSTIPLKPDSSGQVSVYLTFAGATAAKITANGGEIRTASFPDEKGMPGKRVPSEGGVVLVPAGKRGARMEVILSLSNLIDGGALKLAAAGVGADGKDAEAPAVSVAIKRDQAPAKPDK